MGRVHTSVAKLGENVLHLSEDLAKFWKPVEPHCIRADAETKTPNIVRGAPLVPVEPVEETVLFISIVVIVTGHSLKKGVPEISQYIFPYMNG